MDKLEEEIHGQIITDGDVSLDGIALIDNEEESHHDEVMIDDDKCVTDGDNCDEDPKLTDGLTKTSPEKKDGKQTKNKARDSGFTKLQKPGSQMSRKRKDENSSMSKPQTKSYRHQQQTTTSPKPDIKISSRSSSAKSNTHKGLPVPSKVNNKVESERRLSANKLLKNVSNKKKADKSPTKIGLVTSDKKVKSGDKHFDKEKSLAKARKELDMLPSVPSESIAPHLKTIEVHPVLEHTDSDKKEASVTGKPPRRTLPQRKFGTIKSQIDSGLKATLKSESKTRKADVSQISVVTKTAPRSRLSMPQPSLGLSKRSASHVSSFVASNTGSKISHTSGNNPGLSDAKMPKQSRMSLRGIKKKTETPVSSSQQSLSSDQSGVTSEHKSSKRKIAIILLRFLTVINKLNVT